MNQPLSTATMQNPGKITNLNQLSDLVSRGNHTPLWVDKALAQSLVTHYGGNGMVVPHPQSGGGAQNVEVPTNHGAGPGDPSNGGLLVPPHLGFNSPGGGGYLSPSGSTFTVGPGGNYVDSGGFPRATAVDPSQDPYGLSGGPVAGPQPNPGDMAMKGPVMVAKYV